MIHKIRQTFKREGILSVYLKGYYRVSYFFIRLFEKKSVDESKWLQLKNKYKGKRVFLLGNGPSLNSTPLYMLRDEFVICFNRFYIMEERLNWLPNFYMCVDDLVLQDLVPEISQIVKNYELAFFPDRHFRNKNFKKILPSLPNIFWVKPIFGRGFSSNLPKINQGGSVIYEGMQVMKYLGFDEIILLGVDMNFKIHETAKSIGNKRGTNITSQNNDDPNHFDPRYFGKNRSYHQPKAYVIDNIINNLNHLGENLEKYNLRIINAGYGSKVESFPRKDFISLFNYTIEEKKLVFDELIESKSGKKTTSFEKDYPLIKTPEELIKIEGFSSFYTSEEFGIALVKQTVNNYIAMGPFEGKYYFALRKTKLY